MFNSKRKQPWYEHIVEHWEEHQAEIEARDSIYIGNGED